MLGPFLIACFQGREDPLVQLHYKQYDYRVHNDVGIAGRDRLVVDGTNLGAKRQRNMLLSIGCKSNEDKITYIMQQLT